MGTLHVVATPIGNLDDITLRALRVLEEADLLFAEDTRRTRVLLTRHKISARPLSLHAHNEQSRIARALEVLAKDGSVALVSDAGTPLVSDPGERLVAAAIAAEHRVEAIPGASAVLAALAISGLPAQPFAFLGFLPRRAGPRRELLATWRTRAETLVVFESPRRLEKTLRELAECLGDRPACVARELTKLYEEARRGSLTELAEHFAAGVLGEITIVVGGALVGQRVGQRVGQGTNDAETADTESIDVDEEIRKLVRAGDRPREIAAKLAKATGRPKRHLYARAVALRDEDGS